MRIHNNHIAFNVRLFEIIVSVTLLIIFSPLLVLNALYLRLSGTQVFERVHIHGLHVPFSRLQFSTPRFSSLLGLLNVIQGNMGFVGSKAQFAVLEYHDYTLRPGLMSCEQMHLRMGMTYDEYVDDPTLNLKLVTYVLATLRCLVGYSLSSSTVTHVSDTFHIFNVAINNLSMQDAVAHLVEQASEGHSCQQYAFVNTDCLNIAYRNNQYANTLNQCQRVFADGSGIRLASKILGFNLKDNVNGTDMLPLLCQQAQKQGLSIYLLGAKPGVAKLAASKLQGQFKQLNICGIQDGYFSESETKQVIARINQSNADIVLVAMGAPAQELWIAKHADKLNAKVAMGVGGLFDFYAQTVSRAPQAVRQMGMEWTWRLMQEPTRMWRRYMIGNPLFVLRLIVSKLLNRQRATPVKEATQADKVALQFTNTVLKPSKAQRRQQRYFLTLLLKRMVKRVFDIVASSILMLLLSPLLLMTAMLIRVESKGPILFSQTRAGLNNQPFVMWKFRSMFIDAEARLAKLQQANEMQGGVIFKMKSDPRITRIGRFIRKASIDELPQLWNVFKGDMSLVGPRPALPSEVNQYQPSDHRRLLTKPGITCIWQVTGRSDIPFDKQVELDVDYLYKQSFKEDFMLLLKTIPAVLFARGAY